MGVKYSHKHSPNKVCYEVTSWSHALGKAALVRLSGGEFTVAFMGYTGHWYAYDSETGKEIARMEKEFYEKFIAPLAIPMADDPDCVV